MPPIELLTLAALQEQSELMQPGALIRLDGILVIDQLVHLALQRVESNAGLPVRSGANALTHSPAEAFRRGLPPKFYGRVAGMTAVVLEPDISWVKKPETVIPPAINFRVEATLHSNGREIGRIAREYATYLRQRAYGAQAVPAYYGHSSSRKVALGTEGDYREARGESIETAERVERWGLQHPYSGGLPGKGKRN